MTPLKYKRILPKVIFGTSALGNLYKALGDEAKCQIVAASFDNINRPVVFDSAGKYGAGLALESLGKCLQELDVDPDDVLISNKLGWLRVPLLTEEPTFEPGVWRDLKYDAVQRISYEGILNCFEQGNELLGKYKAKLVSVHDPDEYLNAAVDKADEVKRYEDILGAYQALMELKQKGIVEAVGVGAKDWTVIKKITEAVELDWVMIANSMTIYSHPSELITYMRHLQERGIQIVNSAVFNAGFLIGGPYYNYKKVSPDNISEKPLFEWRARFFALCEQYNITPAAACVQFGLAAPGVTSIALSTTNAERVKKNVDMAVTPIPDAFWKDLIKEGLIDATTYN